VAPFRIVNIGNAQPINLLDFINELERIIGKKSKKNFLGMQNGDVNKTHSDINLLQSLTGFSPKTTLNFGILEFLNWYKSYYL
jgi:UDP-glucuronate 4-epimerase